MGGDKGSSQEKGEIEEEWVRGRWGDMWGEWSVVVRGVGGSAIRPVLE